MTKQSSVKSQINPGSQRGDSQQQTTAIWARNLSASYDGDAPVLTNISLDIPHGELIAIVGPNGAGKSTLFNILIGLKQPKTGKLLIFGESIQKQCKKNRIAYVPQHEQIDWDYPISVWNVVQGGRYGHMSITPGLRRFLPPCWAAPIHKDATKYALDAVGLFEYANRPIGALSGGQKKRVFLARALAQDADLLLLDEPLVGVDGKSEVLIFSLLDQLCTQGKTVVMVTHDMASAKQYASQIILINKTIIRTGHPEAVLNNEEFSYILDRPIRSRQIESDPNRTHPLPKTAGGYQHAD